MRFFASFPRPPRPEPVPEPPRPAWMKPEFEVPGSVAVDMVLLRADEAAVTIGLLRAYSTGFEFTVDTRSRRADRHHRLGMMHRRYAMQDGESEDGLRLGLEFSDGRRAEVDAPRTHPDQAAPDAIIVHPEAVEAVTAAGISGTGCTRCRRPDGCRSSPHGRRSQSPKRAPRSKLTLSSRPPPRAIVLWPEAPGQPLGEATIGVLTAGRTDPGL